MEIDPELFAIMSFKGERFNRAFIPVDALPAIAGYQQALTQMAIAIWKEANPDRERLPNNFSKAFELGLRDIGEGSKVAHLPRRFPTQSELLFNDGFDDIFIAAQERLADIVIAANENRQFSPLPENVIAPFERISKSIYRAEYIEITPVAHGKQRVGVFRISDPTVEKIVNTSRIRLNKLIDSIGFISGIIENPSSVRVTAANGVFNYPLDWTSLRSEEGLRIGSVVHFQVEAETDTDGAIKDFKKAVSLSPAVQSPESRKLDVVITELAALKSGWMDGVGCALSSETVLRAREFGIFLSRWFGLVRVYPTVEGGIQFEWTFNNVAASLQILASEFLLGASDLLSDKYAEKCFKGLSPALLKALERLEKFAGRSEG
ncbi:MAG: hypothetical protein CFE34_13765 [Rhodobacteraceae bacterium PARR1]|nr:MAG: hypothetical protein CFE34_13765 [Rhodobacteraceae bacterium PARR1]